MSEQSRNMFEGMFGINEKDEAKSKGGGKPHNKKKEEQINKVIEYSEKERSYINKYLKIAKNAYDEKEIYELGKESIEINSLQNKIELLNMDAKELTNRYETDSFDLITCNPPYFKAIDSSKKNDIEIKTIARHEVMITLEDIMRIARKLLKNNGSIVMVHRPERLSDIIKCMLENNISPKRIQFIYPKENTESNMLIIEGTKNGNNSLKVLNPMIIHEENGDYKDNIKDIFKTIE